MKLEDRFNYKITGIYKITNIITKHAYIGQAKNICSRIYYHIRSSTTVEASDYNYPLHVAFRKYGLGNFDLDILEECDYNKLNEREQYWIKFYSTKDNGYNQTYGGLQSIRFIKLTKEDVVNIRKLLYNQCLYADIALAYNVGADLIYRINIGRAWHNPNIEYPIRKESPLTATHHYLGTAVQQIDKNTGVVLNTYSSAEAAGKALGNNKLGINIGRCCTGKRKTAAGYKWKKIKISEQAWLKLFK